MKSEPLVPTAIEGTEKKWQMNSRDSRFWKCYFPPGKHGQKDHVFVKPSSMSKRAGEFVKEVEDGYSQPCASGLPFASAQRTRVLWVVMGRNLHLAWLRVRNAWPVSSPFSSSDHLPESHLIRSTTPYPQSWIQTLWKPRVYNPFMVKLDLMLHDLWQWMWNYS